MDRGRDQRRLIEWVAAQTWCDGNVGMIGISCFGSMQVLAAAERPPSLKAIFVSGGHYDFYETTYHGGVMWFMPRAAREGRGGDSGWAFTDGVKSRMLETYSAEEIKKRVAERLNAPDVAAWPNLVHVLNYPKHHEAWFDIVMNEVDGDWYEARNPITLAPNIDIPVWLQIGPYPPMQSRPWVEEHDKMFRWYEYWLKGIDNGVMDEPAVTVHVEGSHETATGAQWPPKDVEFRSLYFRPRRKLSFEPELMGAGHAAPDGFCQAPLTVTDKVEILSWSTAPFTEPTEMIGQGAAHLFAEIDQRTPTEPGKIEEYVLRIYPFAATFLPGHRLVAELSNDEPLADEHNALLPPDAFHLPVGRPVTHKIYQDAAHPSRLVLPFTTTAAAERGPVAVR
ncbi:CocE/NonD family hydrolase [Streptomyces sp. NPDC048106]|uniref:CocE/NonD family hydrolase n=1 Tax=Streptomyces sp. NPDC048106 TaxID=3155750 RepID=UPI00345512DF